MSRKVQICKKKFEKIKKCISSGHTAKNSKMAEAKKNQTLPPSIFDWNWYIIHIGPTMIYANFATVLGPMTDFMAVFRFWRLKWPKFRNFTKFPSWKCYWPNYFLIASIEVQICKNNWENVKKYDHYGHTAKKWQNGWGQKNLTLPSPILKKTIIHRLCNPHDDLWKFSSWYQACGRFYSHFFDFSWRKWPKMWKNLAKCCQDTPILYGNSQRQMRGVFPCNFVCWIWFWAQN